MAPRRAESDFGLQGWIDTLGVKQIFLIYSERSVYSSYSTGLPTWVVGMLQKEFGCMS